MNVTQHGEYLFKLTKMRMVNCYLVRENDGLTLIDTAVKGCADEIISAAAGIGLPIVRILLTHAHVDHAGSVDALHAALPDAEVIYPAREARFLAGDLSLDPGEAERGKLRGEYVQTETRPARTLAPGERVGALEAVATPGHTPGHMAFFDTRDRTLIVGDAMVTLGGVAVPGKLTRFPGPMLATWHKLTALESARALSALAPQRLAVGHGNVLEAPSAVMNRAIAKAARAFK